MPKFWEVIYENGEHSVMSVDDEKESLEALETQHTRAKNGLPGGPYGGPAVRITKVLEYDKHPQDFNEAQTMTADEALKRFSEAVKATQDSNGVVTVGVLEAELREMVYPMVDSAPHDSNYKMEQMREVKLAWL